MTLDANFFHPTALVCRKGHVFSMSEQEIQCHKPPYCEECGAPIINACENCQTPIKGGDAAYHFLFRRPAYCPACGKPYPWTELAFSCMEKLLAESEDISTDDKQKLKDSLPDLISETPCTPLATNRLLKVLSTTGRFTADTLRQFAIDFGCQWLQSQIK